MVCKWVYLRIDGWQAGFRGNCPGFVMRGRGVRPCAPTQYASQRRMMPPNLINGASPQKPSPIGRGLGEGESFCASQRHITPPNLINGASPPKPPFRKRGVGGISPAPLSRRAASLPIPRPPTAFSAAAGRPWFVVEYRCRCRYRYKIPPTPLLRKGGFLRLAPTPRPGGARIDNF